MAMMMMAAVGSAQGGAMEKDPFMALMQKAADHAKAHGGRSVPAARWMNAPTGEAAKHAGDRDDDRFYRDRDRRK